MTEISTPATYPVMPDEFFAGDPSMFSYHFEDINKLPIPNEFGWRVVRYLRSNNIQIGHLIIPHDEVKSILATHDRNELASILKANDTPWVPFIKKNTKAAIE